MVLPVPNMQSTGGRTELLTSDGITLQFFAPAGYAPNTKIRTRYTPKAKAKPGAKAKAKPAPKAKESPQPEEKSNRPLTKSGGETSSTDASSIDVPNPQQVEVRIVWPIEKGLPLLPEQLPKMDGAWDWIRKKNDELHRVTRVDAAQLLLETFSRGGFCVSSSIGTAPVSYVRYKGLKNMVRDTKIICASALPKLGKDPNHTLTFEHGAAVSAIEKAMSLAQEGFNVATVSAASAYHVGGGFISGGRHALEEAFCSQSTLYQSLQRAKELWGIGLQMGTYKNDWPAHDQHIPTDGVIVSPGVEIFRGGTDQGYKVHTNAVAVAAVVSVAMYNKNHSVRDAPVDAPKDAKAYEDGIRKKFTAMIHGAALSSADAIIIPDVGCGVFHNDPRDCGRVVGEVLAGYQSRFKSVVFTGDPAFYKAALDGFASGANAAPSGTSVRRGSCCLKSPEAHLYVGTCVICGNGLGGSDFSELALLLDKSHKSHEMQFMHNTPACMDNARRKFPKHQRMLLPDITKNAKSFLAALDLNGNGFIEKSELKCICALLWDGDLPRDREAFEKDFEARFAMWDSDRSGSVDIGQITKVAPPSGATVGPSLGTGSKGIGLNSVPQTCIEWVQEQAKSKKKVAGKPAPK